MQEKNPDWEILSVYASTNKKIKEILNYKMKHLFVSSSIATILPKFTVSALSSKKKNCLEVIKILDKQIKTYHI